MTRVLVLGAGMVAKPLVRHLLERQGHKVTVADMDIKRALRVIGDHPNATARQLDVTNQQALHSLVAQADITVSILPPNMHSTVAPVCLATGSHLVTSSYAAGTLLFDVEARTKGIIILNEMGLDPGIDHFSAMKIVQEVQRNGGTITGFSSYCGGLPAPEANNTLGYRFSWSPLGVFAAMRNTATFMREGQVVTIPNAQLFSFPSSHPIDGVGMLEGYPNRDSLGYIDAYGIHGVQDMIRGTLRVPSWCAFWDRVAKTGVLKETPMALGGMTYAEMTRALTNAAPSETTEAAFSRFTGITLESAMMGQARELGLFETTAIPAGPKSPVEALAIIAQERMQYGPGERDMSVLQHTFFAQYLDHREKITSTLVDFGTPGGDSSMSRLVGLTAAIGVKLIAEEKVGGRGSLIPTTPDIYGPALAELEALGIKMQETVEEVS